MEEISEPVYVEKKGWDCDLAGKNSYEELPAELLNYVSFLEKELNVPISVISVGPDRIQTIMKNKVLV